MILHHRSRGTSSPWSFVASLVGWTVLASFLSAVVGRHLFPSLADVGLLRPVILGAAFFMMGLGWRAVQKIPLRDACEEMVRLFPFVFLVSVLVSGASWWNDGSGAVPLSVHDGIFFILTGGIWPFSFGPESFIRFAVLSMAVLVGVRLMRSGRGVDGLRAGLAMWVIGAVVILVQTWMASGIALFQNDGSVAQSEDALRSLAILHTNSYWSTFQSERFFGALGKPLATSIALSSASLVFVVVFAACVIVLRGMLRGQGMRLRALLVSWFREPHSVLLVSALLSIAFLGLRDARLAWNVLDILAIVMLVGVALAWMAWQRTTDDVSETALILAVAGAALLGWPVLLGVVSLWVVHFFAARLQVEGVWNAWLPAVEAGIVAAVLGSIGGAFAVRHVFTPTPLLLLSLGWGALALAATAASDRLLAARSRFAPVAMVVAGGSLFALATGLWVSAAFLALLTILAFLWLNHEEKWQKYLVFSVVAFAWICIALTAWVKP